MSLVKFAKNKVLAEIPNTCRDIQSLMQMLAPRSEHVLSSTEDHSHILGWWKLLYVGRKRVKVAARDHNFDKGPLKEISAIEKRREKSRVKTQQKTVL